MLSELYINNYLLLPEFRLRFDQGLTVISGETGAGKSILVGSITLIFGDNSAGTEAYDKNKPIYLEATFIPENDPQLGELLSQSGALTDEELILAREIGTNGKSTYFLNGRKTGVAILKELKNHLIDFHHQRDQQKLLVPAYQLEILDAYAGAEELRSCYTELFQGIKTDLKELENLSRQAEQQRELQELYRFQLEELENAKLIPGEDLALQNEFDLLSHGTQIIELSAQIRNSLYEGENCLFDQLSVHLGDLHKYEKLNPALGQASQSLQQALEAVRETSEHLDGIGDSLSADPQRLEDIQARLDLLNSLVYKHKVRNIEELLARFNDRAAQLTDLGKLEDRIILLKNKLEADFEHLKAKADALSELRAGASLTLAGELQQNIRSLSIPDAIFEIRIDKKTLSGFVLTDYMASVSESGQDFVEFLFTANPGFGSKPLAAVVSGGELSRILLAIKKVLSNKMVPRLVILDEIDAGIGGKTAELVGEFIQLLAAKQQVLCITHLAQIAARADRHLAIDKVSDRQNSRVEISDLQGESRLQEIARMLSGSLGRKALEHAKELISEIKKRG